MSDQTTPATTGDAEMLAQLSAKLDAIRRDLDAMKRQRQELKELKDDLAVVSKDVFQTAVLELEQVAPFVQTGDFLYLFKRLVRNVRNITAALGMMESARDFVDDAVPLGTALFGDVLDKLDAMDRQGYFEFLRGVRKILDAVVSQVTPDDLEAWAECVEPALRAARALARPQVLRAVASAAEAIDWNAAKGPSLWQLGKDMAGSDTRRTLGVGLAFMKELGRALASRQPAEAQKVRL